MSNFEVSSQFHRNFVVVANANILVAQPVKTGLVVSHGARCTAQIPPPDPEGKLQRLVAMSKSLQGTSSFAIEHAPIIQALNEVRASTSLCRNACATLLGAVRDIPALGSVSIAGQQVPLDSAQQLAEALVRQCGGQGLHAELCEVLQWLATFSLGRQQAPALWRTAVQHLQRLALGAGAGSADAAEDSAARFSEDTAQQVTVLLDLQQQLAKFQETVEKE